MIKQINLTYDERNFKELTKLKEKVNQSWEQFFLTLARYYDNKGNVEVLESEIAT